MGEMIRKISIDQGKEFQIYVHKEKIDTDDVFIQAYQQAAEVVDDLVRATQEYHDDKDKRVDFLNNIIAFCGERGQGKSSAMVTFMNELCKVQPRESTLDFSKDTRKAQFYGMDIIDPATFENYQDVLEILVSRMYKVFEKEYKSGKSHLDKYKAKDMVMVFQDAYKSIGILKNPKKLQDGDYEFEADIEKLNQIGDSSMFRNTMMELVKHYLELVSGCNDVKDKFLVIAIDDLDVSINAAYSIAERIRKYLLIPNVIIVMALKVEQLRYCVEKEFTKELAELQRTKPDFVCQEAKSMAGRYVDKLIPNGRKIYLPEIKMMNESGESKVEIEFWSREKIKDSNSGEFKKINLLSKASLGLEKKEGESELGINEAVLSYIFQKTGIVFVKKEGEQHLIVPNNLRELVSLLAILGEMKNPEEDNQKYVENLKKFKEYFINTWIVNNLNDEYQNIFEEFIITDLSQKHKYVCHTVFQKVKELRKGRYEESKEGLKALECEVLGTFERRVLGKRVLRKNLDSISAKNKDTRFFVLSDALNALDTLENEVVDKQVQLFVFGVKTVYTIEMNTLYRKKENHKLYRFIGGAIWSLEKQQRMIRGNNDRVSFSFPVIEAVKNCYNSMGESKYFYNIIKRFLGKTFVEHIKIKSECEENAKQNDDKSIEERKKEELELKKNAYKYYFMFGCMCRSTKRKYNMEEKLVGFPIISDNNILLTNAMFRLDFLFLASLNEDYVERRFCKKNKSKELAREGEDANYNNFLKKVNIIPINVELIDKCYNQCKKNTDIKKDAKYSEYYELFVKNINRAMQEVDNYLGYMKGVELIGEKDLKVATNVYVSFCESTERNESLLENYDLGRKRSYVSIIDLLKEASQCFNILPNGVTLEKEYQSLLNIMEGKTGNIETDERKGVKEFFDELNSSIDEYNEMMLEDEVEISDKED